MRVWLTPDSPYNGIVGDTPPTCADPANQIKYYDQSGNANSDSSKYSDIFVVGDKTGGFYKQSDWTGGKEDFRPLNGITGNRGDAGQVGKDYIFVKGDSTDYKVTSSSNNNANSQDNTYDGLKVTDSHGKGLYGNSNQIEGVIFGDGGSTTNPGTTTTVVETKVQQVSLNVDLNLSSDHNAEQLTQIKLSGIPEGAKVVVSDGSTVSYKDGTYTIDLHSPTFKGTITVELEKGVDHLGEIKMEVDSTASEHHDTHFTFDGETGEQTNVPEPEMMSSRMMLVDHDGADTDTHDSATEHDAQHDAATPAEDHAAPTLLEAEDDISLNHIDSGQGSTPTTALTPQPDASLSNLLGDMEETHVDTADTAPAQASPAAVPDTSSGAEPVVLSEVLADTDNSQDLSSLIKVIEQGNGTQTVDDAAQGHATPVAEVAPVDPAADSYHGGDESLMDSLIAKPDPVS